MPPAGEVRTRGARSQYCNFGRVGHLLAGCPRTLHKSHGGGGGATFFLPPLVMGCLPFSFLGMWVGVVMGMCVLEGGSSFPARRRLPPAGVVRVVGTSNPTGVVRFKLRWTRIDSISRCFKIECRPPVEGDLASISVYDATIWYILIDSIWAALSNPQ